MSLTWVKHDSRDVLETSLIGAHIKVTQSKPKPEYHNTRVVRIDIAQYENEYVYVLPNILMLAIDTNAYGEHVLIVWQVSDDAHVVIDRIELKSYVVFADDLEVL